MARDSLMVDNYSDVMAKEVAMVDGDIVCAIHAHSVAMTRLDNYSDPIEVASRIANIIDKCDLSKLEIDPPEFRKE